MVDAASTQVQVIFFYRLWLAADDKRWFRLPSVVRSCSVVEREIEMFVCKYVCKHACRPAMVLGLFWRGLVCRVVAWRGLVCCVASNGMRESSSLDKVWWSVSVTVAFHSTRLDFDST